MGERHVAGATGSAGERQPDQLGERLLRRPRHRLDGDEAGLVRRRDAAIELLEALDQRIGPVGEILLDRHGERYAAVVAGGARARNLDAAALDAVDDFAEFLRLEEIDQLLRVGLL